MEPERFFFLICLCLYLFALVAFLYFLEKIPRVRRLAVFGAFCAVHIFVAWVLHNLQFVHRNAFSGARTLEFFKVLQVQLSSGDFTAGLPELPGIGFGILLSLLAVAAIIGGAVCCWLKVRWYSHFILPAAFVLSSFLFAYPDAADRRQDAEEHNALRCRTYAIVADKRIQGVTTRQMAELIGAKLRDYHTSYESREDEKESVERILAALEALTPQKDGSKRGPGPSAGK